MSAVKITEGIYSVGIQNPNMRVFDIVMKTDSGTTYNSYVVKGSEKTALIETCHEGFFHQYLENIKEVCPLEEIDYIIMNHNEPDHSGSMAKLLELMPKAKIIASQAGSLYLKNITNRCDLDVQKVKDGETLDLGGRVLTFFFAPNLHWPDSMFKALPVQPEFICTSHGPVLTKAGRMDEVIANYEAWSAPVVHEVPVIPVFYTSAYGNTAKLAEKIREGILEAKPNAECVTYDIIEHDMDKLHALINECDAFAVGSPTLNRDAVPPVWNLLAGIDAINAAKKPALVFGSFGWTGEAVGNIQTRLLGLKMNVFEDGFKVTFVPSEEDLENAKEFGKSFALSF